MRFRPFRANLGLWVSSLLTLGLVACGGSASDSDAPVYDAGLTGPTRISALTEKSARCEESLRAQIMAGKSFLLSSPGFEDAIAALNRQSSLTVPKRFSLKQERKQFSAVVVKNIQSDGVSLKTYNYELGLNDSTSKFQMYLEVEAMNAEATNAVKVSQRFNVATDCALQLVSTSTAQTTPGANAGAYVTDETIQFKNGEKSRLQKKFTLPVGQTIADFFSRSGDLASMKAGMKVYADGIPTTLNITALPDQTFGDFTKPITLKMLRYSMVAANGASVIEMFFGSDGDRQIFFEQNGPQKTWKVPQDLWAQTLLGTAKLDDKTVSIQWPKDYLLKNSSFTVLTATAPDYDHLASYWSLSGGATDPQSGLLKYAAVENRSASAPGATTDLDLVSNDTIQTKLPRIQKIAQDILKAAPHDRRRQVGLILKWLKDNYAYDNEMVNNNVVRPLTTEEALSRGKGVCQHYSVIFTSIARALGIPTRIVLGYAIWGAEAGLHAWVEAQFDGQAWQVIEPQFATGLKDTQTRNYLPLMRANQLEDITSSSRDYFAIMLEATYILKAR